MRTAFVCDTAYQVFNMLNFRSARGTEDADLFLCDCFASAGMIYQRLLKEGGFSHVVRTRPHRKEDGEPRLRWYVRHACTYLFPARALRRDSQDLPEDFRGYDEIYTSSFNHIAVCLLAENPAAALYLIDDGAGSYYADPANDSVSTLHRIFTRIFHVGAHTVTPRAIYLYQTNGAGGHTEVEVRPLPRPTEEFLAKARTIFAADHDDIRAGRRAIWLTQPDEYARSTEAVDRKLAECFSPYRDAVLVRRHPRDDRAELYRGFAIDPGRELWELTVPFLDEEGTLLLGVYSTAQMTPKQIYDREPTAVFLFRLYQGILPEDWIMGFTRAVEELRALYRKPERIVVPESMEELERLLKERLL